jgi:CheY-like chemotaxis protein
VKTILVIEDDISILRGLKDNLEFEGYVVITETNGEKGLQLALAKKTDLILLDIMLPGMNGYEICRKLKKEKPDLPADLKWTKYQDSISALMIMSQNHLASRNLWPASGLFSEELARVLIFRTNIVSVISN